MTIGKQKIDLKSDFEISDEIVPILHGSNWSEAPTSMDLPWIDKS